MGLTKFWKYSHKNAAAIELVLWRRVAHCIWFKSRRNVCVTFWNLYQFL